MSYVSIRQVEPHIRERVGVRGRTYLVIIRGEHSGTMKRLDDARQLRDDLLAKGLMLPRHRRQMGAGCLIDRGNYFDVRVGRSKVGRVATRDEGEALLKEVLASDRIERRTWRSGRNTLRERIVYIGRPEEEKSDGQPAAGL